MSKPIKSSILTNQLTASQPNIPQCNNPETNSLKIGF